MLVAFPVPSMPAKPVDVLTFISPCPSKSMYDYLRSRLDNLNVAGLRGRWPTWAGVVYTCWELQAMLGHKFPLKLVVTCDD